MSPQIWQNLQNKQQFHKIVQTCHIEHMVVGGLKTGNLRKLKIWTSLEGVRFSGVFTPYQDLSLYSPPRNARIYALECIVKM